MKPFRAGIILNQGFTLIELLAVISISGILASLLLGAILKVKPKCKSIACLNNVKQLQLAWTLYTLDNGDRVPPNISRARGPAGPFRQGMPGSWVLGNAKRDGEADHLKAGVLYPYNTAPGIYQCPSDTGLVLKQIGRRRTRSYSMDIWLNVDTDPTDCCQVWVNPETDPLVKTKLSQLVAPSGTFVFIDEHEKSIDDGIMVVGHPEHFVQDVWYKLPADRHNRGCTISFVDGHVSHWTWKSPKQFRAPAQPVTGRNADPGQNDAADLHQLQAALPRS